MNNWLHNKRIEIAGRLRILRTALWGMAIEMLCTLALLWAGYSGPAKFFGLMIGVQCCLVLIVLIIPLPVLEEHNRIRDITKGYQADQRP
jgi:hypothetical protein